PGHAFEYPGDERIPHLGETLLPRPLLGRQLEGAREGDDARDVLGPRAAPPLLAAAVQDRLEWKTRADREGADTLRRAQLVPGDAHGVDAERGETHLERPRRLHG